VLFFPVIALSLLRKGDSQPPAAEAARQPLTSTTM
jgi:hypothetical protein